MKLALFRHAEKQILWGADPVLTAHGENQARNLLSWVKEKKLPVPTKLISSPRKRAQQTLTPLAQDLKLTIEIATELDERNELEDREAFRNRVRNFTHHLEPSSEEILFVCTHMDWIEEFTHQVPSDSNLENMYWSSAGFMLFEVKELWHLLEKGRIP